MMGVWTATILVGCLCFGFGHGDCIVHDHEDNYGALIKFIVNAYNNNETMSDLVSKVQTLERQMAKLLSTIGTQASGGAGSTYTRWGRTACPGNGSDLLYAGYMAGLLYVPPTSSDVESGHGGNYVCLPYNPTWNHYSDKIDHVVMITGVEYGMWPYHQSDISDFFGSNIRGQQAPCSVCRSIRSQVMIPGRSDCFDGWTLEYKGYLVFGYPIYNEGTEFVCLDDRPEHAGGSSDYEAKNRIFLVEANSDFGLDDSYGNGREIACVVCSI